MNPSEQLQYGVELYWPDGTVETHQRESRASAERMANWHNAGDSICTARIKVRVVTVGDWHDAADVVAKRASR